MEEYTDKKPAPIVNTAPSDYLVEKMIKSFMKQVQKDGIMDELKKRRFYQKPSEIKRLAEKNRHRPKRGV